MAGWDDLPLELKDIVLQIFGTEIIQTFSAVRWDKETFRKEYPSALLDYCHAVRTCRYVHRALSERLRFDGERCNKRLQRLQHLHLKRELSTFELRVLKNESPFYSLIGRYWYNPIILDDSDLLDDALRWVNVGFTDLIREVKPWIFRHFQPVESYPDKIMSLPFYQELVTLWFRVGPVWRSGAYELVSIEEIVEQPGDLVRVHMPAIGSEDGNTFSSVKSANGVDIPLVDIIKEREPNTFWVIGDSRHFSQQWLMFEMNDPHQAYFEPN